MLALHRPNPKSESRNSKQIQISNVPMTKTKIITEINIISIVWGFGFW